MSSQGSALHSGPQGLLSSAINLSYVLERGSSVLSQWGLRLHQEAYVSRVVDWHANVAN